MEAPGSGNVVGVDNAIASWPQRDDDQLTFPITNDATYGALIDTKLKACMNSLCITGGTPTDLQFVAEMLHLAGMKRPKPGKRDESIDIDLWHEQVVSIASENAEVSSPVSEPGKLWDQLASDIFVANIKSNVWGWFNPQSVWLLDYWLDFEPGLNFILVCSTPQHLLASVLAGHADVEPIEAVMSIWERYHQELLRFHHRNPQRSLLVDAAECIEHPHALVELCAERWQLPLSLPEKANPPRNISDSLALYLAQQMCRDQRRTESLQHELAATITRLDGARSNTEPGPVRYSEIVSDYRKLHDHSSELAHVKAAQDELATLKGRLNETLEKHQLDLAAAGVKLNKSSKENELLLMQLHQVQEELEAVFLKNETAQKQVEAFQQKIAELSQECDNQGRLLIQCQSQIETLNSEKAALTLAREEHEKLQGQQELRIETLVNDLAASKKMASEQQAKLKDVEQENELLLLQLHQVQEELEHYFLQHQTLQQKLKETDAKWARMLSRNPGYCDYESIEVAASKYRKGDGTVWKVKDINISGRSFHELEFETIIENGVAGYIFTRQSSTSSPLVRWPATAGKQDEVTLIPMAVAGDVEQRVEVLRELAASDWNLLQALTRLLANNLANPSALKLPKNIPHETLLAGLAAFQQGLGGFPPTVRYDNVRLKREQVNPDYEHLWMAFENLSFGEARWPKFEFRLSCGNVRPNHFGSHPKLEFPEEGGQSPFEAWFAEAYDDFGAKLELRFALPGAMDLDVWHALSVQDRNFLCALLERLPSILRTLRGDNNQLKRPWEDWENMAKGMQKVVSLRIAQSAVMPGLATAAPPQSPPPHATSPIQSKPQVTEAKAPRAKAAKPLNIRKPRKA